MKASCRLTQRLSLCERGPIIALTMQLTPSHKSVLIRRSNMTCAYASSSQESSQCLPHWVSVAYHMVAGSDSAIGGTPHFCMKADLAVQGYLHTFFGHSLASRFALTSRNMAEWLPRRLLIPLGGVVVIFVRGTIVAYAVPSNQARQLDISQGRIFCRVMNAFKILTAVVLSRSKHNNLSVSQWPLSTESPLLQVS